MWICLFLANQGNEAGVDSMAGVLPDGWRVDWTGRREIQGRA
jgi:hypothetical protein